MDTILYNVNAKGVQQQIDLTSVLNYPVHIHVGNDSTAYNDVTASFSTDGGASINKNLYVGQKVHQNIAGDEVLDVTSPITNIQGVPVSAVAPTIDQVLKYDGSEWVPQVDDLGVNIYNSNGTLTTARSVDCDNLDLAFINAKVLSVANGLNGIEFDNTLKAIQLTQEQYIGMNFDKGRITLDKNQLTDRIVLETLTDGNIILNSIDNIVSTSVENTITASSKIELDSAEVDLLQVPPTNNANTGLLTRNAVSGEIEIRDVTSLPSPTVTGAAQGLAYFNNAGVLSSDSVESKYIVTNPSMYVVSNGCSITGARSFMAGCISSSINADQSTIIGSGGCTISSLNSQSAIINSNTCSLTPNSSVNTIINGQSCTSDNALNCIIGSRIQNTGGANLLVSDSQAVNNPNSQTNTAKFRLLNGMNVTNNTTFSTIGASALLQLDSTNKGFLPPRMTTVQRTAIGSPASGLVVYDTDLNSILFYNGTVWIQQNTGFNKTYGAFNFNKDASGNPPNIAVTNDFLSALRYDTDGRYILFSETLRNLTSTTLTFTFLWYSNNLNSITWQIEAAQQVAGAARVTASTISASVAVVPTVINDIISTTLTLTNAIIANGNTLTFKLSRLTSGGGAQPAIINVEMRN